MGGRGASFERQGKHQLRKGIRSLEKRIREHKEKVRHPERHVDASHLADQRYMDGLVSKWKREISNFEKGVIQRKERLREAMEYNER